MSRQMRDFTGQRIGMLEVLSVSHKEHKHYYWLCQCDCGNTTTVVGSNLSSGLTKSCGCLRRKKKSEDATPIIKTGNRTVVSVNSYHYPKGGKGVGWRGGVSSLVGSVDL